MEEKMEELRMIVAGVLEIEPGEISNDGDFVEEYEADSMLAIEILARIEKRWKVDIPQAELPEMRNLAATHRVVARYAGWAV